VPDDLAEVRRRIEQWRTRRSKLGAMPESLWAEAIAMAARHGFWLVACVLRLNCTRLRARLAESVRRVPRAERDGPVTFVELKAPGSGAWPDPAGAVVELSGADGAKLLIRARGGESVDVLGLAEAFWRRRA
jgi:hypothetical protein